MTERARNQGNRFPRPFAFQTGCMPAFELTLAGIPLQIVSPAPQLTALLADYFRYYAPQIINDVTDDAAIAGFPALQLALELRETLPAPAEALAEAAQLVAQNGEVRLWQASSAVETASLDRFYFHAGAAAFLVDVPARRIWGYVNRVALAYPRVLANTYTLFPLLLLLRAQGVYHLHAAAALSPRGKLCLFPAASRAGKTTLTTALGLAGWQPLADDSVFLQFSAGQPLLTPLRKEFHLTESLLTAWPALELLAVRQRYFGRACVEALEFFQTEALAAQTFQRVAAFILPQIAADEPSHCAPLAASVALLKLAEQSVFLQIWRDHTARQFKLLSQLVQGAACYEFKSGPDLLRDPLAAVQRLTEIF